MVVLTVISRELCLAPGVYWDHEIHASTFLVMTDKCTISQCPVGHSQLYHYFLSLKKYLICVIQGTMTPTV